MNIYNEWHTLIKEIYFLGVRLRRGGEILITAITHRYSIRANPMFHLTSTDPTYGTEPKSNYERFLKQSPLLRKEGQTGRGNLFKSAIVDILRVASLTSRSPYVKLDRVFHSNRIKKRS
jgi:hypothetical protein